MILTKIVKAITLGLFIGVVMLSAKPQVLFAAEPSISIEDKINTGGWGQVVKVAGNYAYATDLTGTGLYIFSLTNPDNPVLVGEYNPQTPLYMNTLEVAGNYAYLGENDFFEKVDISNPKHPVLAGSIHFSEIVNDPIWRDNQAESVNKIFINDNYAYLSGGSSVLTVVDLTSLKILYTSWPKSSPYTPVLQANSFQPIANYKQYLYGTSTYPEAGFKVYDLSNPAVPTQVLLNSDTDLLTLHNAVTKYPYIYATSTIGKLIILDITNPITPVKISTSTKINDDFTYSMALDNNKIYYTIDGGVQVVDVSNVAAPKYTSEFTFSNTDVGMERGVAAFKSFAYVVNIDKGGFHTIDFRNNEKPILVSDFKLSGNIRDIVATDKYQFVGDDDSIYIYEINNTDNFELVNTITEVDVNTLTITDSYLYAGDSYGLVSIYDISNPKTPSLKYRTNTTEFIVKQIVIAQNSLVYVVGSENIHVYDAGDLSSVKELATFDAPSGVTQAKYKNGYLYLLTQENGLKIYDVSDVNKMTLVGKLATGELSMGGLSLKDTLAYVGDWNSGLLVIDVSNQTAPTIIKQYSDVKEINDIVINDHYAYIACGNYGVKIYDIAKSENISLLTYSIQTQLANAKNIAKIGDYLAVNSGGLVLAKFYPNGKLIKNVEQDGYIETYSMYDPNSSEQFAQAVTRVTAKKKGKLLISYSDDNTYVFTVFKNTVKSLLVQTEANTGWLKL
ncbi:MAG: hypothetical protein WCW27_06355, partial [Patescibacteria group bacterium]